MVAGAQMCRIWALFGCPSAPFERACDAAAHGPLPGLAAQHSVGTVSGKWAGGHDLIKLAIAGNPGELERIRG